MPGGYYVRSMEEAHRQTMRVDTLELRCGKFQKKTPPLRMAQSDRVLVGSRERVQVFLYVSERFTQCFFFPQWKWMNITHRIQQVSLPTVNVDISRICDVEKNERMLFRYSKKKKPTRNASWKLDTKKKPF